MEETLQPIKHTVDRVRKRYGFDREICPQCDNLHSCSHKCYPLTWVDGDKPRREKLLSDPYNDELYGPDYNLILSDLSARVDPPDRLDEIVKIPDKRQRAICALIACEISADEIAGMFKQSRSYIYLQIDAIRSKLKK